MYNIRFVKELDRTQRMIFAMLHRNTPFVAFGYKDTLLINSEHPDREEIKQIFETFCKDECFGMPEYDYLHNRLYEIAGKDGAYEVIMEVSRIHDQRRQTAAKEWAAEWLGAHDIAESLDNVTDYDSFRISALWNAAWDESHNAYLANGRRGGDLSWECAKQAIFLYGYELGLEAARTGSNLEQVSSMLLS